MEPLAKKRRLAPKMAEKPSQEQYDHLFQVQRFEQPAHLQPHAPQPDLSRPIEHASPEAFAHHVVEKSQIMQAQSQKPRYKAVFVLTLRWEQGDPGVEQDVEAVHAVFRDNYNYHVEDWQIPSSVNPSVNLTMRLGKFLEYDDPEHLLILYYVGHGYSAPGGGPSYWTCNLAESSPKLKFESAQCLIENARSDMLLLLDGAPAPGERISGSNGTKHGIACNYEQGATGTNDHEFAFALAEQLLKLSAGPAFDVQILHEEIAMSMKTRQESEHIQSPNGTSSTTQVVPRVSSTFTLTPDSVHSIILSALSPKTTPLDSPDGVNRGSKIQEDQFMADGSPVAPEADGFQSLALVRFLADPNMDANHLAHQLNGGPNPEATINVESIFHGQSTLVLMTMPSALCDLLVADHVCSFVAYTKSHNLIGVPPAIAEPPTPVRATERELEDGKILLEVASAAVASPVAVPNARLAGTPNPAFRRLGSQSASEHKDNVEDSVEMHEAAEQLKALSHFRQLGHGQDANKGGPHLQLEESIERQNAPNDQQSSPDAIESGADESMYNPDYQNHSSRPKPRRSIQKQGPKQDTRCTMCSHAPFKDSSSLRKHVAAAHTRPFPCAFSFAGCTSTFGSKNEWKRHIASQHLCLTYYRCSSCPQSTIEGKGNEFNRKDLFTQHLRRMHAPFAIKKAIAKGDSKLQMEWESHVKEMQQSCLVIRRSPPQRSACPKQDCSNVFEGAGSWDDWTEHVGRHMEKGEASRLGVDPLLARWALEEGIIERREDGEYRLCGGERDGGGTTGGEYFDESVANGNSNGNGNGNGHGNGMPKLEDNIDTSLSNDMVG